MLRLPLLSSHVLLLLQHGSLLQENLSFMNSLMWVIHMGYSSLTVSVDFFYWVKSFRNRLLQHDVLPMGLHFLPRGCISCQESAPEQALHGSAASLIHPSWVWELQWGCRWISVTLWIIMSAGESWLSYLKHILLLHQHWCLHCSFCHTFSLFSLSCWCTAVLTLC